MMQCVTLLGGVWFCALAVFCGVNHSAQAADEEFHALFDGKTLAGWSPSPGGNWEVKDGAILGTSPASERRHGILLSDKQYSDFTLRAKFRVVQGDSGLYFRAEPVQGAVGVHGFQVEVDTTEETGGLYETGGRGWVVQPTAAALAERKYKPGEWTDLELTANGQDITVKINGVVSAELKNDRGRREGRLGLQLHGGQEMHVEYKDIAILVLGQ
ncbi:MAG: DUF1080 domain-containing protein [Planctomycetales bacterium]|nr:DUF1080 domain-containing protein [Planctomycetales bacterium]